MSEGCYLDPSIIPPDILPLYDIEEKIISLEENNLDNVIVYVQNLSDELKDYARSCILQFSKVFRFKWKILAEFFMKCNFKIIGDPRYTFTKYLISIRDKEDLYDYEEIFEKGSALRAILDDDFQLLTESSITKGFYDIIGYDKVTGIKLNLLDLASIVGNSQIFRFLLMNGMKPTVNTMECAIISGNIELCEEVHQICSKIQESLIFASVKCHRYDILQWFINEYTPNIMLVSMSVTSCSTLAFAYFLQKNGGINSFIATSLLGDAYESNNLILIKYLIKNGADVNAKFGDDEETLLIRSCKDNVLLTNLLVENGADTEIVNSRGYTPLNIAAMLGNIETAKVLIEHGANTQSVINTGQNFLDIAKNFGNTEFVEYFKEKGGFSSCYIC